MEGHYHATCGLINGTLDYTGKDNVPAIMSLSMASGILLYNNISKFCKGVTHVYTLTYTGNSG